MGRVQPEPPAGRGPVTAELLSPVIIGERIPAMLGKYEHVQFSHAATWIRPLLSRTSFAGGAPNILPYSRVNCGMLS